MKRADPLKSEGARLERKATRTRLRRRIKAHTPLLSDFVAGVIYGLKETLGWVLSRQDRYDKRPGGLGRTPLTIRPKRDDLMPLWGKAVRLKYGTTCLRCGRAAPRWKIDAAHILSRGAHPKLKYVVENGIPLCFLCHRFYDEHKDTALEWVQTVIGMGRYMRLFMREKTAGKLDRVMVRLGLQAQIAELEGGQT